MATDFDDFQKRKEAAFKVLRESGISSANFNPPMRRLLERLGLKSKPPHFASFLEVSSLYSIYFGVVWGLTMWLLVWRATPASPRLFIAISAGAGICFGLSMAAYYAYGRRKYKLPSWDSLVS